MKIRSARAFHIFVSEEVDVLSECITVLYSVYKFSNRRTLTMTEKLIPFLEYLVLFAEKGRRMMLSSGRGGSVIRC